MRFTFTSLFAVLVSALMAVPHAAAADLPTPTGLNPGDTFRFIFQTAGTTTSASTAIADYNSFVNTQAAGATYEGSTITWYAVGSTATVDARDNVGGFATDVPVYLVTGTQVATDMSTAGNGLWAGNLLSAVQYDITGTFQSEARIWTGTSSNGTKVSGNALGDTNTRFGVNSYTDSIWISVSLTGNSNTYAMYAISAPLTVVPEPSTFVLGAAGAIVAVACARHRKFAAPMS